MNRRKFLRSSALAAGGLTLATGPALAAAPMTTVPATQLARLAAGANVCLWFRFPRNESSVHFSQLPL